MDVGEEGRCGGGDGGKEMNFRRGKEERLGG